MNKKIKKALKQAQVAWVVIKQVDAHNLLIENVETGERKVSPVAEWSAPVIGHIEGVSGDRDLP